MPCCFKFNIMRVSSYLINLLNLFFWHYIWCSSLHYPLPSTLSTIFMVVFIFACCVILLNILIAQLSDTYQKVQQDAQRGLEVNRAWIVARVELNSCFWFRKVPHNMLYFSFLSLLQQIPLFSEKCFVFISWMQIVGGA